MDLAAPPQEQDLAQGQYEMEFSRFEFMFFLLLDRLPWQG